MPQDPLLTGFAQNGEPDQSDQHDVIWGKPQTASVLWHSIFTPSSFSIIVSDALRSSERNSVQAVPASLVSAIDAADGTP
jgi:hypothetical protein